MKKCSKCQVEKPVESFGNKSWCRECVQVYDRDRYKLNREAIQPLKRQRAKAWRVERSRVVDSHKNKPCADCKKEYPPYVMQFDHVRGEKKFEVCDARHSKNLQEVLDEIAKCEVVCANCHAERTHSRLIKV